MGEERHFKPDKWNRVLGSRIPELAKVTIIRFMPRRRVIISFGGEIINTMLWCVPERG